MYKEVKGDLIQIALGGDFDVIAHGCNCFCSMKAGIAVGMAKTFMCDQYELEKDYYKGDINKLGCIQWNEVFLEEGGIRVWPSQSKNLPSLYIVNAYTQYHWGKDLNLDALSLCLKKIGHEFKGKRIGLPMIGCGLAGGNWEEVKLMIQYHLKESDVTIVIYNK